MSVPKEKCHPDRSAAKWRPAVSIIRKPIFTESAALPFVIPTRA